MTEHTRDKSIDSFVYLSDESTDECYVLQGGVCVKGCYQFLKADEYASHTAWDIVKHLIGVAG